MKLRIIKLTPEFLTQLLQGKTVSASNLPSDAELLDIKMDLFSKQVQAIVRSDSFEDVAENSPIPELIFKKVPEQKTATKPLFAPKVEPKPEVPAPATASSNSTALKMANEFSPDQRKLLSFNVKGDVVVVKPVQFLKTEWDDINEVVKSLGGRWVRGDIISYWEIPLP